MKNTKNDGGKRFSLSRLSRGALIAIACFFALIVILLGVVVGVFFALKTSGRMSMEARRENEMTADTSDYVYDPDVITFDGKKYRYNEELTTFLFMGIDTPSVNTPEAETEESAALEFSEGEGTAEDTDAIEASHITASGGQADVLLVIVLDEKAEKVSIISVDRNSMSYFEGFDGEGNSLGVHESQLALAYAYGDSAHTSCRLTVDAVSDFLYEIPIHAYYSMKLGAVRELNDAVGGVPVTIPVDMTAVDESFIEGETVTLMGESAEKFLVARQGVGDGTNAGRLDRQKQYLMSFIDAAISAVKKDWSLPKTLYSAVSDNSCTDITVDEVVYLADLATRVDISYYGISGTTDTDGTFAEFRPDADALWQLILDIFYICEE